MNGIIALDKSPGLRSTRAVAIVKKLIPRGIKVGHAGGLDPFASGLLILLIGRATRQCEQIMSWPKTYIARIRLGATTLTDDPESPQTPYPSILKHPTQDSIKSMCDKFVGVIQQRPPAYTALKVRGKRASDRLRKGERIELPARTIQIHSIQVLNYTWPDLDMKICCGRGTYIRALARDLGEALGVGGHVISLRRTQTGDLSVEKSVQIERLTKDTIGDYLLPLD